MRVKDIMTSKVLSVKPDTILSEAVKIMLNHRISGLPVIDDEDRVIALITKSDIIQMTLPSALKQTGSSDRSLIPEVEKYLARLRDVSSRTVRDMMIRKQVYCAHPAMSVSEAAVLMYANEVRRLPVIDDEEKLTGIVSYSDIAAIIAG